MSRNEKVMIYYRDNATSGGIKENHKARKSHSLNKTASSKVDITESENLTKDNSKSKNKKPLPLPNVHGLNGVNFNSLQQNITRSQAKRMPNKRNKIIERENKSFTVLNELCASADSPALKKSLMAIVKKETFSPIRFENYTVQTSPVQDNSGRIKAKIKNYSTCTSNSKIPTKTKHIQDSINLDNFFTGIDKYNKEMEKQFKNKSSGSYFNTKNSFKFENIYNLPENSLIKPYNEIWNKFLNNIENISLNYLNTNNMGNNYIYNINNNTNKKETETLINNLHYEYENLKNKVDLEIREIKMKLYEKEQEIQELNNLIQTRDIYIKDMEVLVNNMNAKFCKNYMESIDNNSADEVNFYTHKQLLRDFKNLSLENKGLRELNTRLEKENNIRKDKEMKIMQLLYTLNKKGIPIDDIVGEIKTEQSDNNNFNEASFLSSDPFGRENKSIDNSIYTPINIDPPKFQKKPDMIPTLNLNNINDQFNSEYISPMKQCKVEYNSHNNGNIIGAKNKQSGNNVNHSTHNQNIFNTVDTEEAILNSHKKLQLVSNLKNFKTKIFSINNVDLKNKFKLNLGNLQEKLGTESNKNVYTHSTTMTTVHSPTNNPNKNTQSSSSQHSSTGSLKNSSLKEKMKKIVMPRGSGFGMKK